MSTLAYRGGGDVGGRGEEGNGVSSVVSLPSLVFRSHERSTPAPSDALLETLTVRGKSSANPASPFAATG
jgi:hypothetical protein